MPTLTHTAFRMQLHHAVYGDGFPLLILHGFLGAGGNWHTLASKRFGAHFRVYTLDARNHGRSPHSDVFDYPTMAADVAAFMDQQGIAQAHVLGHSMGGKTAMHLALRHGERVARLVVVDMAPGASAARHDALLDALVGLDLSRYDSRRAIDQALAPRIPAPGVRQFLLKNLSYDPATRSYSWQMNLPVLTAAYEAVNAGLERDPGRFDGPTLFVRGGRSDYVTEADEPLIRRLFPRATVTTIAQAGHWVHAEAPGPFAEAVLAFLTQPEV